MHAALQGKDRRGGRGEGKPADRAAAVGGMKGKEAAVGEQVWWADWGASSTANKSTSCCLALFKEFIGALHCVS